MNVRNLVFGAIFLGLLLGGCDATSGSGEAGHTAQSAAPAPQSTAPAPALAPTFSSIRANIFAPKCLSCHSGTSPQAGINLESPDTIVASAAMHGHAIIVPGVADESHLVEVVEQGTMPPGGPKLSDAEIAAIRDWINQGAQNN
jgi:mono/diheme cytochrome c family protein